MDKHTELNGSERPKAVGVWCQPIEGLLYDLNILPEQLEEFSQNWRIMKVIQEMHAHFEASELFMDALESENAALREFAKLVKEAPSVALHLLPIAADAILCEVSPPAPAPETEKCERCEGLKIDPNPKYNGGPCKICKGQGWLHINQMLDRGDCPTCKGTGIKPKTEGDRT